MTIVAEFALYLFMEVLMLSLGRCAIFVLSLGHARAQSFKEVLGSRIYTHQDGKLVFSHVAAQLIGILCLFGSLSLYFSLRH
jgi:hypothetical protein